MLKLKFTGLIILLLSCKTKVTRQEVQPTLLDAKKEVMVSPANGDRTFVYAVTLSCSSPEKIKVDSLWVGGERLKLNSLENKVCSYYANLFVPNRKEEQLKIDLKGSAINEKDEKIAFPIASSANAILSFYWGSKRKFIEVPQFESIKRNGELPK